MERPHVFALQKPSLQLRLDLRVGDPGPFLLRVHIGMDPVIQTEMAGNAHEVCDHLIPLVPRLRFMDQHLSPLKKLCSRFPVHSHAFLVHLVLSERFVKKQNIRSMRAKKKAVPLFLYDPLDDRICLHIYFSPVKIMCKCCRHETHLLCNVKNRVTVP